MEWIFVIVVFGGILAMVLSEKYKAKFTRTNLRRIQKWSVYGVLGVIVLVAIPIIVGTFKNVPAENPSFYDTGDIEDMNTEELEDYMEWKEKQEQKEFDEKKIYD